MEYNIRIYRTLEELREDMEYHWQDYQIEIMETGERIKAKATPIKTQLIPVDFRHEAFLEDMI